jgi:ABC-type glycerol-3-phosphate transport system substrate-binding protein
MRRLFLAALLPLLAGCSPEKTTAVLWTDRPEFTLYAGWFNAQQDEYKIEAVYLPAPAQSLLRQTEKNAPDLVAAAWLKSGAVRSLFAPLGSLFTRGLLSKENFYPSILQSGCIGEEQYLLPVSFNIPAMVFSAANSGLPSGPFTLSLDELRSLGDAYNSMSRGVYTRMGFSPAWDDGFLFSTVELFNANFREDGPIAWDAAALDQAISCLSEWSQGQDIQKAADFVYKYFYEPQVRLILSGRILFAYMDSAELFTLPAETASGLDFRWLSGGGAVRISENSVYLGISRQSAVRKAAEAFTVWFFRPETQSLILQQSRTSLLSEGSFGIAGGFSGLRTVNGQIFPQFYPSLLGHSPPEELLTPPNILPGDWPTVKERVLLPWLHERVRNQDPAHDPLDGRIADWYRVNPIK